MSAATMGATVARSRPQHNPPLKLKANAIVGRLQHFATNGPAYVQFQATRSLARIVGLFDKASDALKELGINRSSDQTESKESEQAGKSGKSGSGVLITSPDQVTKEDDDYL